VVKSVVKLLFIYEILIVKERKSKELQGFLRGFCSVELWGGHTLSKQARYMTCKASLLRIHPDGEKTYEIVVLTELVKIVVKPLLRG